MIYYFILSFILPSFYDGLEYYDEHRYEKAISEFEDEMDEEFENTDLTQKKVEEMLILSKEKFLQKTLDKLKDLEDKFLYKKALKLVLHAKKVLKINVELSIKANEYKVVLSKIKQNIDIAKMYADNDDWEKVFEIIKNFNVYREEFYDIRYLYKKSSSKLYKIHISAAKAFEKNNDIKNAISEYEKATIYDDDSSTKKKLKKLKNQVEAKKQFDNYKLYKDKDLAKAYDLIKLAYSLDERNDVYENEFDNTSNSLLKYYFDKAKNKSLENAYKYLMKAKEISGASRRNRNLINDELSDVSKKLASKYYKMANKSASIYEAYINYLKSYILNSKLISSKNALSKLEKKINTKYNVKIEFINFNKDMKDALIKLLNKNTKGIVFNTKGTEDAIMLAHLKKFDYKVKEEQIPKKVRYLANYKKDENIFYTQIYKDFNNEISKIKITDINLHNYFKSLKNYIDLQKDIYELKTDINNYKTKEYNIQKQTHPNIKKEEIKTPYDSKYKKSKLLFEKINLKTARKLIDKDKLKEIKRIHKLFEKLKENSKYYEVPIYKNYEYDDVLNTVTANYNISLKLTDYLTEKVFTNIDESYSFYDKFINVPEVSIITIAGKQSLVKERKNKTNYYQKTKSEFLDKLDLSISKSKLKYYGDRFYISFKNAKNINSKFKYGLSSIVAKEYLSEKENFINDINKFMIKNYNIDFINSKLEF